MKYKAKEISKEPCRDLLLEVLAEGLFFVFRSECPSGKDGKAKTNNNSADKNTKE